MMYRIAIKAKNGLKIGLNAYTLEEAQERAKKLEKAGFKPQIVPEEELFR